jgi:glycosyltransferase involved in cell wall biosynthesis
MSMKPSYDLSVVIASYNRRELLRRCLDSLGGQAQDPATFEVVVADDGSGDGTADMVEGLDLPFRLRTLRLKNGGWASAQNAGIEASTGRICLCLDDDVVASPRLVAEHIEAHETEQSLVGIGKLVQKPPDVRDWYAHAFARGWNEHYEDLNHRPPIWKDCYGANLSAPRSVLIQTGGYATDLPGVEDVELGIRLVEAGCTLVYLPRAEATHDDQKVVAQMLRDAQRIGFAQATVAERHPSVGHQALEWVGVAGPRELALRRLLIPLRVKPSMLASMGRLIPDNGRKMVWLHFVRRFTFWRSVRRSVSRSQWRELTSEAAGDHRDVATQSVP